MKNWTIISLSVAFALLLGFAQHVNAGGIVIFQDDFQSDEAGTAPTSADLDPVIGDGDVGDSWSAWMAISTANAYTQVLDNDPILTGPSGENHYLKMAVSTSYKYGEYLIPHFHGAENALVEVSFRWYMNVNGSGAPNEIYFGAGDGTGRDDYVLDNLMALSVHYYDGSVRWRGGAPDWAYGACPNLTAKYNEWNDVKVTMDLATRYFDIELNGAVESGLQYPDDLHDLRRLTFLPGLKGTNCIDDLLVQLPLDYFPGDANRDGTVDEIDAAILADNWLTGPGATWIQGDFNADGYVNDKDATLMATNWQGGAASVPEPAAVFYLAGLLLLFAAFRRRGAGQ